MIARLIDQDLSLVHQAAKGGGVNDPVAIALVQGPVRVRVIRILAAATLSCAHGVRGQNLFLAVEPIGRFKEKVFRGGIRHVAVFCQLALSILATSKSYSESSDCTITFVSARTGMKLVSPRQRGTICQ